MKRRILVPLSMISLIIFDQVSKWWIVGHLSQGERHPFLSPIFSLVYVRNYGAAFSILQNQQWLFALITILVIGGAGYYLYRHFYDSLWLVSALVFIIAGGLANFIDRLRLGYVVDMIHLDFIDFAVFNLADSCLSLGVFLLMIAVWKEEKDGSDR
ncbi:signal peptidase II [Streptococcus dentasini]